MKGWMLSLLASVFILSQAATAQAATTVSVLPATTNADLGSNFIVTINISTDNSSTFAAQFDVYYDTTKLNATSATEGDFLKKDGATTYPVISINYTTGRINYGNTRFGVVTGVSGSGGLMIINFNALATGTSNVGVAAVTIVDTTITPITISSVTNGTVKVNRPPSASNLQISPASPKKTDNLTGSYTYSDPDSDPENGTEIRWYKDSVLQAAYNNLNVVPSGVTSKGQKWYFTVKPKDGISFGAINTSANVTIQNTAPTAPTIAVVPALPKKADNLLCNITNASTDVDGDTITYAYAWYKNSVLQGSLTTNIVTSGNLTKGQAWNCTVTPSDGTANGPAASSSVTVQNTAPTASSLLITPASPKKTDSLTGSYTYTDADSDAQSGTQIRWYKEGVLQAAYNDTLIVSSSAIAKGQRWYFTVTPRDGTDFGTLNTSANVTIQNTAPTAPTIALTPASPITTDNLFCNVTNASIDIDGDTITYAYAWYKNGALQASLTTNTVPHAITNKTELWNCTVTPSDGSVNGPSVSKNVTIANSAPAILSSSPAASTLKTREGFTLQFNHTSSDIDLDALTYSWKLDGSEKATTQSWLYSPVAAECGNRTISLNISDGTLAASTSWIVTVGLKGDVNGDRTVNIFDLAATGLAYGSTTGGAYWNAKADLSTGPKADGTPEGDGKIDIFDLATVGLNYGRTC